MDVDFVHVTQSCKNRAVSFSFFSQTVFYIYMATRPIVFSTSIFQIETSLLCKYTSFFKFLSLTLDCFNWFDVRSLIVYINYT